MHKKKSNAQPTWIFSLMFSLFAVRAYAVGTRGLRQRARSPSPRIVNGVSAPESRFPYMCSIQQRTTEQHVCGGVLIGCRWVLTAAHCFVSNHPGRIVNGTPVIRCGIHKREDEDDSKTFSVEKQILHEEWNGVVEDGNDIALLKLTKTTDLRTPDLDAEFSLRRPGLLFAAPGWGVLGVGERFSDELQVAPDLSFVSLRSCNKEGAWNNSIKPSMICAGFGKSGTCQGDSGGPLLTLNRKGGDWKDGNPRKDLVVGITSYGEGVCDENLPGIYTRVSSFLPWILAQMGDDDCSDESTTAPASETSPTTPSDPPSEVGSEIAPTPDGEDSTEASESAMSPQDDPVKDFADYCGLDQSGFMLCIDDFSCPDDPEPPQTRMEEALEKDDADAVQELLCCSLDVNSTLGRMEYPLLTLAVRSNAIEAAKTLLENGADRDGVDSEGLTGLSHAIMTNSIPALEILIACEPDVERADDQGRTPLHYAAAYGNLAAVQILLDNEASTLQVDYYGKRPIDLICTEAENCSEKKIEKLERLLR